MDAEIDAGDSHQQSHQERDDHAIRAGAPAYDLLASGQPAAGSWYALDEMTAR